MHRLRVKESDIPISLLYNSQINKLKAAEHQLQIKENAILIKVEHPNIARVARLKLVIKVNSEEKLLLIGLIYLTLSRKLITK